LRFIEAITRDCDCAMWVDRSDEYCYTVSLYRACQGLLCCKVGRTWAGLGSF